jgi:hypothetical protein
MKSILLIVTMSFCMTNAFALAPTREMQDLSRLFINNPHLANKLSEHCSDHLEDFTSSSVGPGVTKFVLTFGISLMCPPVKTIVTITEDMKPTYADGAPLYQTTIKTIQD